MFTHHLVCPARSLNRERERLGCRAGANDAVALPAARSVTKVPALSDPQAS